MQNRILKTIGIIVASIIVATQFIVLVPSMVFATENTNIPKITYRAHVQDYGWENTFKTPGGEAQLNTKSPSKNNMVGTMGESKRMEALEVNIDAPSGVNLKYRAHVQDYGWMEWETADNKIGTNYAGTSGKAKRVEAFQIVVEGLENYEIKYRVHAQDYGWLDWVTAKTSMNEATTAKGNYAGTVGEAKRMEALEIVIIPTNKVQTNSQKNKNTDSMYLTYRAHVQDYGWENTFKTPGGEAQLNTKSPSKNNIVGTMGESKRMEALEVNIDAPSGVNLKYRAHVQDYGWMEWKTADNKIGTNYAGTSGKAKRVEAFQIVVEGLENYEIKYRVHAQDYGWLDWVTAKTSMNEATTAKGNYAGTVGEAKRMEALEIVVIPVAKVQEDKKVEEMPKAKVEETPKTSEVHSHSFTNWEVTTEPTCMSKGEKTRRCTICGEEQKEIIADPNAHKTVKINDTDATCENFGRKNCEKCTICGQEFYGYVKPLGHSWSKEYTTDIEATCTKDGVMSHHCTREGCSAKCDQVAIQATGHQLEEKITKATCTEIGTKITKCKNCDYIEKTEIIEQPKGHQYSKYISDGNATCSKDGTKTAKCTVCGHSDTITDENTKLEHKFITLDDGILPTCEKEGREASKQCIICGEIKKGATIAATGHNLELKIIKSKHSGAYIDEKCTRCGLEMFETEYQSFGTGHTWKTNEKGETYCTVCCGEDGNQINDENGKVWWSVWKSQDRTAAIWFAGFTCNMDYCNGFVDSKNNKTVNTILEGRRGSKENITMKAPQAKNGYVFEGWYEVTTTGDANAKKVTTTKQEATEKDSNSKNGPTTYVEGDTITVSWRDMCKGYEARYTPINK